MPVQSTNALAEVSLTMFSLARGDRPMEKTAPRHQIIARIDEEKQSELTALNKGRDGGKRGAQPVGQ